MYPRGHQWVKRWADHFQSRSQNKVVWTVLNAWRPVFAPPPKKFKTRERGNTTGGLWRASLHQPLLRAFSVGCFFGGAQSAALKTGFETFQKICKAEPLTL